MMLRGVSCFLRSRFSRRRRLESIAFFNRISVLSTERGFSRKSYAPSLVARTAVSMVPCPEIMMTSGGLSRARILCRVSSPSMPGSHTSSRTTSKACFSSRSRHASPLSASPVLKPSSSSTPRRESRMPDSSSTMRMLCMLGGGCCGRFRSERKFHDEAGANRLILFDPDGALMVFDDAAHDGQAQTGAALLGGEIRQKEFFLQFLGHSVTGVGDSNLHGIATGDETGGDSDFAQQRALHGLGGIVHQVCQGALDGIRISHHLGQIGREILVQTDAVEATVKRAQGAFDDGVDVGRMRLRCGEAGEGRKLIDQGTNRVD